ncbi:MAG: hypothetical protein H0V80_05650 [Acidobacteria bacterium]|nr:hypothetical protein [Acidobacteriota bacterium]
MTPREARTGDAARFETVAWEAKHVDGIRVVVATPAALYRLKRDTVRAIDRQDAEALRQRAFCVTALAIAP